MGIGRIMFCPGIQFLQIVLSFMSKSHNNVSQKFFSVVYQVILLKTKNWKPSDSKGICQGSLTF